MKETEIIDYYRSIVIQIATPYSTGTGFYLKQYDLIVTNEHVIRDNRMVIVKGVGMEKQLAKVLFFDENLDIAFLEVPTVLELPEVNLALEKEPTQGDRILAIGHPFGLKYSATQGIISNVLHKRANINYIQHDAALNPGNSGGPLVNMQGEIVGMNTFIIQDGDNIGFSLPVSFLATTLEEYVSAGKKVGVRCASCSNMVYEHTIEEKYCPYCGAHITLPSAVDVYEPVGVAKTIEEMLKKIGHSVPLTRRGPNNWEIQEGSAKINISYHEKTGLITGDAYLCYLPKEKNQIKPLYEFLLKANHQIEGLNFSIKGMDIMLSLLIYDRYLNADTGIKLFKHLFERADYFDNILVEEYGARWKYEEQEN
ncbi:MAG: trypsin-like peptidase domain-containing protein [Bacteroidota bacterium]